MKAMGKRKIGVPQRINPRRICRFLKGSGTNEMTNAIGGKNVKKESNVSNETTVTSVENIQISPKFTEINNNGEWCKSILMKAGHFQSFKGRPGWQKIVKIVLGTALRKSQTGRQRWYIAPTLLPSDLILRYKTVRQKLIPRQYCQNNNKMQSYPPPSTAVQIAYFLDAMEVPLPSTWSILLGDGKDSDKNSHKNNNNSCNSMNDKLPRKTQSYLLKEAVEGQKCQDVVRFVGLPTRGKWGERNVIREILKSWQSGRQGWRVLLERIYTMGMHLNERSFLFEMLEVYMTQNSDTQATKSSDSVWKKTKSAKFQQVVTDFCHIFDALGFPLPSNWHEILKNDSEISKGQHQNWLIPKVYETICNDLHHGGECGEKESQGNSKHFFRFYQRRNGPIVDGGEKQEKWRSLKGLFLKCGRIEDPNGNRQNLNSSHVHPNFDFDGNFEVLGTKRKMEDNQHPTQKKKVPFRSLDKHVEMEKIKLCSQKRKDVRQNGPMNLKKGDTTNHSKDILRSKTRETSQERENIRQLPRESTDYEFYALKNVNFGEEKLNAMIERLPVGYSFSDEAKMIVEDTEELMKDCLQILDNEK